MAMIAINDGLDFTRTSKTQGSTRAALTMVGGAARSLGCTAVYDTDNRTVVLIDGSGICSSPLAADSDRLVAQVFQMLSFVRQAQCGGSPSLAPEWAQNEDCANSTAYWQTVDSIRTYLNAMGVRVDSDEVEKLVQTNPFFQRSQVTASENFSLAAIGQEDASTQAASILQRPQIIVPKASGLTVAEERDTNEAHFEKLRKDALEIGGFVGVADHDAYYRRPPELEDQPSCDDSWSKNDGVRWFFSLFKQVPFLDRFVDYDRMLMKREIRPTFRTIRSLGT